MSTTWPQVQPFDAARRDCYLPTPPAPSPRPALPYIGQWLAAESKRQPAEWLLHEARALHRELLAMHGVGLQPQTGAHITELSLGDAEVPVEYEYSAGSPSRISGPPEDCYEGDPEELTILGVYINGKWCDAVDVVPASVLEQWEQTICDRMAEARDDDLADRAAAERDYA